MSGSESPKFLKLFFDVFIGESCRRILDGYMTAKTQYPGGTALGGDLALRAETGKPVVRSPSAPHGF